MAVSKKAVKRKKDYSDVVQRYKQGAKIVDLAKEYGISRVGMYLRLKEEGVTDFRDDRKKIDAIDAIDMYNQGMTMMAIAKHYGCAVSSICMLLKRYNVIARNKAILPDLENIDIVIPDVKKDQREAFKEFQKDFGKQLLDDRMSGSLFDDEDGVDDIEMLLKSL